MKASLIALSFISLVLAAPAFSRAENTEIDKESCSFKGKPLYGKIKVVDAFPDITVQVVDAFPDLEVKKVDAFASACGQWKFVTSFADLKIKFVSAFADIKIKYVDAFPGLR